MPPKEKLTKEEIELAAFELLREKGIGQINARCLARRLSCSTMPLFRHFEGMEEIRLAAVRRAEECYQSYIRQGLSEPVPFKGAGKAYIRFAKEEPRLFELFFMTPPGTVPGISPVDPMKGVVVHTVQNQTGFSVDRAEQILQEMWLFVHGIATAVVTKTLDASEECISQMMTDVFQGLKSRAEQKGE